MQQRVYSIYAVILSKTKNLYLVKALCLTFIFRSILQISRWACILKYRTALLSFQI